MECPTCGAWMRELKLPCPNGSTAHWHRRLLCLCGQDLIDINKEYFPR